MPLAVYYIPHVLAMQGHESLAQVSLHDHNRNNIIIMLRYIDCSSYTHLIAKSCISYIPSLNNFFLIKSLLKKNSEGLNDVGNHAVCM